MQFLRFYAFCELAIATDDGRDDRRPSAKFINLFSVNNESQRNFAYVPNFIAPKYRNSLLFHREYTKEIYFPL